MDNSPVHTSYETLGWLMQNKKFFKYDFLPRYCPRMNVVEFFNNIIKNKLKKNGRIKIKEVINTVDELCKQYNSRSKEVVEEIKSLFLKEECSYIKTIYDEESYIIKNKSEAKNNGLVA